MVHIEFQFKNTLINWHQLDFYHNENICRNRS